MSTKSLIVWYNGKWVNETYIDGEKRFVLVHVVGITFEWFLDQIQSIVAANRDRYDYLLSSLVDTSEFKNVRLDIKNDIDLKYVMENFLVPNIFVTLNQKLLSSSMLRTTFTDLLLEQSALPHVTLPKTTRICGVDHLPSIGMKVHASGLSENVQEFIVQSENCDSNERVDVLDNVVDDDDVEVDSLDNNCGDIECLHLTHRTTHVVPPLNNSSDVSSLEVNSNSSINKSERQWVIPGAVYQASLPVDKESTRPQQYARDTLSVDAIFVDKESIILALGLHHLINRVEFKVRRSSTTRFSASCKLSKNCPFFMRAKCYGLVWRIKRWKPVHTCRMDFRTHGPRTATSKIVGAYFAPRLLTDGAVLKLAEMKAELKREFGVHIKYKVALGGRNYAIRMIYGDSDKSFQQLPSYLHMVNFTNPGSKVELLTDDSDCFVYAFMSLSASISGFLSYCRPVIVVDGTHLKGSYKGVMFVASTKDGNEQIFPLAVGIGDKETDDSWIWFFRQLRLTFGCPDDLMFVSDQHTSIKKAISTVYPGTPHGICVYHLQKNLVGCNDDVIAMFQGAANCYRISDFNKHMESLQRANAHGAITKLMDADPTRWARSKSVVRRYEFLTSNCAESLNGRLRWARRLPVCTLLECVRTLVGHWFVAHRHDAAVRGHELTEWAAKRLESSIERGDTMEVEPINDHKFKVISGQKNYVVDLSSKTCSCRVFDLDLIPCAHAAAAISKANQSYLSYVSNYYTMETLRKTYSGDIYPIPNPDEWDVPDEVKSKIVGVPANPKQAGRPRISRMKPGFASRVCSRCHNSGHNRASCSATISAIHVDDPVIPKARRPKTCGICRARDHNRRRCPARIQNPI